MELAPLGNRIVAMSEVAINNVYELEKLSLKNHQEDIDTQHLIHAGMYARTILIKKDVVLTGALIKKATILIISGTAIVYAGDTSIKLSGYNVIPASANRKQAFYTKEDTYITMVFPTGATSVNEAENEFTDEAERLISRKDGSKNIIEITGE